MVGQWYWDNRCGDQSSLATEEVLSKNSCVLNTPIVGRERVTCTGTAEPPDDSEGLLRGEVFWTTAPARDEASLDGLPIVALKPMCVVLARRRLSITDCQGRGNARQRGRDGEHRRFQGVSHDGANTGMG
eukprot:scaffold5442_cov34-Tisochrysis_lutea.AAC.2